MGQPYKSRRAPIINHLRSSPVLYIPEPGRDITFSYLVYRMCSNVSKVTISLLSAIPTELSCLLPNLSLHQDTVVFSGYYVFPSPHTLLSSSHSQFSFFGYIPALSFSPLCFFLQPKLTFPAPACVHHFQYVRSHVITTSTQSASFSSLQHSFPT